MGRIMGNFKKPGHCESRGGGTKQSQGTTSSIRFIRSLHDEISDVNFLKTHAIKCDTEEEHTWVKP
jgi:hypothetical protein